MRKTLVGLCLILLAAISATAQNRFEGYNILVDAPDTQTEAAGSCATRYVPTTTDITITDLNPKTPLKINSCGGNFEPARQVNSTTAVVRAGEASKFKWCFVGEDASYRITFNGDRFTPKLTYTWLAEPAPRDVGVYNVRDFGATGDGKTDDTTAIRSTLAFAAAHNGGRVVFPDGDYAVGNSPEYPNYKGLTLPSGVIVEGTGSNVTGASINNVVGRNASRITLRGNNPNANPNFDSSAARSTAQITERITGRAVFRIGECTDRVAVRDIELHADSDKNSFGIEAVGAYTPSQAFYFDRVSISNFYRGFYAHALPVNNRGWQFDFVKVNACRFVHNRDAAIWIDFWNSDWTIRSSEIFTLSRTRDGRADGLYIFRVGTVLIEDTYGGATTGDGGDFIHVEDAAQVTVISSECEGMKRSIAYSEVPGTSNLSFPLTLMNNIFDQPVEMIGARNLVSIGNFYGPKTIKLGPLVRVYSMGDRFCYDGHTLGCTNGPGAVNFAGGQIIFSTGQPADAAVPGRPTVFGGDVQFNGPVQMPNLAFENLPKLTVNPVNNPNGNRTLGNGAMLYCTNCKRNSAPCQNGGGGAPAMFVNGRWDCL